MTASFSALLGILRQLPTRGSVHKTIVNSFNKRENLNVSQIQGEGIFQDL